MSSVYGKNISVSIFGQSHAPAIGVTIDGLPAGIPVDSEVLQTFLNRRAPGKSPLSTPRKEGDKPEFLCGIKNGKTVGAPLTAIIRNMDTRSSDYENTTFVPRPGHADYTAHIRYNGCEDHAGGGHFSGRLTAPLCIAGGIALQYLESLNIFIGAHITQIAQVTGARVDPVTVGTTEILAMHKTNEPFLHEDSARHMMQRIHEAKMAHDSVGGIIECVAVGMPAGVGDPIFDGLENRIARAIFGVPAVKGIEFGAGFGVAELMGSQNNDPFTTNAQGDIKTVTNNAGGILGGISTGMPIVFRVALKPTPSIALKQDSINLETGLPVDLSVEGRHDPSIVMRAVPVIEAACGLALMDALLEPTAITQRAK